MRKIYSYGTVQGSSQPFKVRYKVLLGSEKSKEVNVPYVATIGPETPSTNPNVSLVPPSRPQAEDLLCSLDS